MNSIDEHDRIKIWDLETSWLISTLNQENTIYDIKDIGVIREGRKLVARDGTGITFWGLNKNLRNLNFGNSDITFSKLMLLEDGNKMMFNHDDVEIKLVDLKNNMKIIKTYKLSEDIYEVDIIGNGDIFQKIEYEDDPKSINWEDSFEGDLEDSFRWKLIYVDMDQAPTLQDKENHFDITGNFVKKIPDLKNPKHEYVLYDNKDEVTAYNIITNKGLSYPNVFQNNNIIQDPNYSLNGITEEESNGQLYFGTDTGDAFKLEYSFDKEKQLKKKLIQLFTKGVPNKTRVIKTKIIESDPNLKKNEFMTENEDEDQDPLEKDDPKTRSIHECIKFLSEDIEVVTFSKSKKINENNYEFCQVYVKNNVDKEWAFAEFNTEQTSKLYLNQYFKAKTINNFGNEHSIKFFLYSDLGIAIMEYDKETNKLKTLKFLNKKISSAAGLVYSAYKNLFYLSSGNTIQIWNESLKFSIYSLDFKSDILSMNIQEDESDQLLLIYDDSNYYEINLETLKTTRKISIFGQNQIVTPSMPFNINIVSENKEFVLPTFSEEVVEISFIANSETLNLKEFPFEHLAKCFSKEDYLNPIKNFATYYFKKLELLNYEDSLYGPLNPIFFALYHNDMGLLEYLLDKYRYPRIVKNYWSPLEFAFRHNYYSATKVFCDRLIKRTYDIEFTRCEFHYLLKSSFSYCHKLISSIPSEPTLQNFPRLMFMTKEVQLHYVHEIGDLLYFIKKNEMSVIRKRLDSEKDSLVLNSKLNDMQNELKKFENTVSNEISKREVITYHIPFKYSYKAGTPDSVRFLDSFSESTTEEFILSEWKEIIKQKWEHHRAGHVIMAIIYWIFTICTITSIVFLPDNRALMNISLTFIFFFLLLEILQVLSYATFKFKK